MIASTGYDIIDLEQGKLDPSIFTDQKIYQEELEQIFGRAWVFVSHINLIPNPNDFFLSYIGEDPVIVTRDSKGEVHVFLNMCRHRGNRVVRADDGNAKNFMCTYHGWTFSNEGKLVSVPGLQEAYYGELDVENLSLVEAKSDIYAGLIFATWADDAPTLEDYLGDMRWYLDVRYNHREGGVQVIGPVKWVVPVNWKTPVENASGDNYHAVVSHMSSAIVQHRFKGARYIPIHERYMQPGRQTSPGNGHGLLATVRPSDDTEVALGGRRNLRDVKSREKFAQSIIPEVERRIGTFRAHRLQPGNFAVFPNLFLGLRIAHPRGPLRSEIWTFESFEKDAPEEVKATEREQALHGAGHPGGLAMQDDMDNWRGVTDSGSRIAGRGYLHDLSMGLGHEGPTSERPGRVSHVFCSEINQRSYYARWQEFMNARSWKDIHLDPSTVQFEGDAQFRG